MRTTPACDHCGQYVCRCSAPPIILPPSVAEIARDRRYSVEFLGSVVRLTIEVAQ